MKLDEIKRPIRFVILHDQATFLDGNRNYIDLPLQDVCDLINSSFDVRLAADEAAKRIVNEIIPLDPHMTEAEQAGRMYMQMALKKFIAGSHRSAWINVTDRLPEIPEGETCSENVLAIENGKLKVMCLVYIQEGDIEGKSYNGYVWANCYGDIDGEGEWDDDYAPTKWMPLPKDN